MLKKIIIILAGVVVMGLIIWGFIWFVGRNSAPVGEGEQVGGSFPIVGGGEGIGGLRPVDTTAGGQILENGNDVATGQLFRLTLNAISGASSGESTSTVRYIERGTGNVYDIDNDGQNNFRVSNKIILKTFDSFWAPKADKAVVRYFDDSRMYPVLQSFVGILVATTTPALTEGDKPATTTILASAGMFPKTVTAMTISPFEDKIFYIDYDSKEAIGAVTDFGRKKTKELFSLPFGEIGATWHSKDYISIFSKPSYFADGFLYFVNAQTGEMKKIMGGMKGLMTSVSPDSNKIIYSWTDKAGREMQTRMVDRATKDDRAFHSAAMPEKCLWSRLDKEVVYCAFMEKFPLGQYPDDWYQGTVSFSDSLYRIDFGMMRLDKLNSLNVGEGIDAINLFLNKDESFIFFTNKKDGTLWSVKISE